MWCLYRCTVPYLGMYASCSCAALFVEEESRALRSDLTIFKLNSVLLLTIAWTCRRESTREASASASAYCSTDGEGRGASRGGCRG